MVESSEAVRPRQGGPWRLAVIVVTVTGAIVILASLAGVAGAEIFWTSTGAGPAGVRAPGEIEAGMATMRGTQLALALAFFQIVTIAMTWAAARWLRRDGVQFLPCSWPRRGLLVIPVSVVVLLVMASAGGALVYQFDKPAFAADMKPFADMAHTKAMWALLIAAAVGAPLAEEVLFRGLLFAGLRASPLGFSGAALVSGVLWSALHVNYSIYGMALVLAIGLYFAWLRERTGSLVPSLVCHSVYNGVIVLALAMAPEGALG